MEAKRGGFGGFRSRTRIPSRLVPCWALIARTAPFASLRILHIYYSNSKYIIYYTYQ
jgi:hypothetical protein